MTLAILFPSSFFNINKVDEDLQVEYNAVLETELFDTYLFGYDKWFNNTQLVMQKKPDKMTPAIYRGWMMKPEQYDLFYHYLLDNNIKLITTPTEYQKFHVFPNIYENVSEDTAKMCYFPSTAYEEHPTIDIEKIKTSFDKFMVKDYVKSVKGTNFPQFFTKDVTQEIFDNWMDVFYKYRGDLFTGGICIKEFFDLKKYAECTNEYRVFYVKNTPISISPNSNQTFLAKEVPQDLVKKYSNLPSPFYTIDFAELEDETWKIIEAGDGSVSGLSPNQNEQAFFKALYHKLKDKIIE